MDYIKYFQNNKGLERFFLKAKDKYKSYGKVTGVIVLEHINYEETISLTDFFAKKFIEGNTYQIKIKEFNKIIEKSKYSDFDFLTYFYNTYSDFNYLTNDLYKKKKEEEFNSFINDLVKKLNFDRLKEILKEDNYIIKIIRRKYYQNKENIEKELFIIDKLLLNIPQKITYLPIYASLTSNPHYLDFNTKTSNFFFKILSYILKKDIPTTTLDKIKLLEEINVYVDPISNFVTTYNLVSKENWPFKVMNLSIDNIFNIKSISGKNNKIFIFENPSILNHLKNLNYDVSIIITSGIPNLAFYKLLETISLDTKLYYNGDYDPEGLLIADKLKNKYSNLELFGYKSINYYHTNPKIIINKKRLHKLDLISSRELEEVKKCLLENKKCGYQENNLFYIEKFIKTKMEEK